MTDIEGSALLWDTEAEAMSAALAEHDELVEQTVRSFKGRLVKSKGEGDATLSVFEATKDAASAAIALQRRLRRHEWPTSQPIKVRIALDTGEADARAGDFFGPVLNRCARLRGAGHGDQILLSSAAAGELKATPVRNARLKDLGTFRLKGLKNAERVYQLSAQGLPESFDSLRALDVRLHNLPQETASSVGREREIEEAVESLRSRRLVTIWGSGGTGKTHLALRVAAQLVDELPDGAWWVDLVGVTEPGLVPDHVARVLGVGDPKTSHSVDDLCVLIQERDLVLILDNCEHIVEPVAEMVSALLERCSSVRIVTTSRERLGVAGEKLLPLGGLALPAAGAQTTEVSEAPSIRLFLDRAQNVGVVLGVADVSSLRLVETVCRRVEGLPLAIELAAGALATMSLPTLADEISERLYVLDASPRRGRPTIGRRTIRGTIEWSTSRITEEERRALVGCSVFAGAFGLEAARLVAGSDTGVLVRLVDQSLISRDLSGVLYRLLQPIREFAAHLPGFEADLDAAKARFLDWLVQRIQVPDARTPEWLNLIEGELDNLRGGLKIASNGSPRALCEIVANATAYWHVRGPVAEGKAWIETALEQCEPSWTDLRARLSREHGFFAYWLGDYEASSPSYEEALRLSRDAGNRALEARILTSYGLLTEALGDLDKAKTQLRAAVLCAREVGERRTEADSLSNLGMIAWLQGDPDEAAIRYEQSLRIRRDIGDVHGIGISLYNLGEVAAARADTERATSLWREAFETWLVLKDRFRAAATLRAFALLPSMRDAQRSTVALGASEAVIQLLGMHEPASALPPELAGRRDECRTELGTKRFEELEIMGSSMSLEEAARYVGLLAPSSADPARPGQLK